VGILNPIRAVVGIPNCRFNLFVKCSSIHVPKGRLDPAAGLVLDIPALMAVINAVSVPTSISVALPQMKGTPKPSQAAQDALSQKWLGPLTKVAEVGVLFGVAIAFAAGLPGIVALGIAAYGGWLLFRSLSSEDGLLSAYRQRVNAVSSRMEYLQRSAPIEPVLRKKTEALAAFDEFKRLAVTFDNVRSEYDKQRRQKQLDDHLSQFSLREARIAQVNSSDLAQLASWGFTTAFDAKRRDVQQVHGIGPVKAANIEVWIWRVEARFQFHSVYTPEDQRNIQKAQDEIVTKQQGLEARIKKAIDEFRQEAQGFERWKATRDPELVRLAQQLEQAEVDLRHVGIPVQSPPNVVPTPVQQVSAVQRATQPINSGTTFGGGTWPPPTPVQPYSVTCPRCGDRMVRRTARRGTHVGQPFWGCSRYPICNGMRPI
jgi:hypothetical protein